MIKIVLLPEAEVDPRVAAKAHRVLHSALRDPGLSLVKRHEADVQIVWYRDALPGEKAHVLDEVDRLLDGFVYSNEPSVIFLAADVSTDAVAKTVLHELGHVWDFVREANPDPGVKARAEKNDPEREQLANSIARQLSNHQYA